MCKRLLFSLILLALASACREPAPPAPTPAPAPALPAEPPTPVQPPPEPQGINGTAALPPVTRSPAEQARLESAQAALRQAAFDREGTVEAPAALPDWLRGMVPAGPVKVVAWSLHRGMDKVRPAPGHRRASIRFVTTLRGEGLKTALRPRFEAAGFLKPGSEFASPLAEAARGALSFTIAEPDSRPARVDLAAAGPDDAGPIAAPWTLLAEPPAWAEAVGATPIEGFELDVMHATLKGRTFSDLERLSVLLAPAESLAFQQQVTTALLARGFKVDDDDVRLLHGPGRVTFTMRDVPGTAQVVLHHQRRWQRGAPVPSP